MVTSFHALISRILNIPAGQVERTIGLLGEGATIPFISRYRKEVTGGLDEVQIGNIKDQLDKLTELKKRKESILSSIEEQGKLTPELKKRIEDSCLTSPNGSPKRKLPVRKDSNLLPES